MSNFKIDIGRWQEYWVDGSLALPSNWALTAAGTGTAIVVASSVNSGYVLKNASDTAGTYAYFSQIGGTYAFGLYADRAKGYTIEARLAVVSGTLFGHSIVLNDNSRNMALNITATQIYLAGAGASAQTIYTFDATVPTTYRITAKGDDTRVYVNNIERMAVTASSSSIDRVPSIYFGMVVGTNNTGEANYEYIRYNTDDAFAPNESWVFDKVDMRDKRTISESALIRSDKSIIPANKMAGGSIRLSGTIAGSCYDSLRNAMRRLKKLLNGGYLKVYLDDQRFTDALHTAFSYNFITKDFAEIDVDFRLRYPYFQNNWGSYFSTAPVTATSYYLENQGDLQVPCKINITGAAATTVYDNLQFDNETANESLKFRGCLQKTQVLTVDGGFGTYNSFSVSLAGTGSVFASFEGDLPSLAPGENRILYTGSALGTIQYFWREAFLL